MADPLSNTQTDTLGTITHQPGREDDLTIRPQQAPVLGLELTIEGQVDSDESGTDHALQDFGVSKLLRQVELIFDGKRFVSLRGDDLFTFQLPFLSADGPLLTRPDPTAGAAQDIAANLFIPLMPQRLVSNPFRWVHWPGLAVPSSSFRLQVEFEEAQATAGSDAGTGAIFDGGGTDNWSFVAGEEPDVQVEIIYNDISLEKMIQVATRGDREIEVAKFPSFAPKIRSFSSQGWDNDRDDFTVDIPGDEVLAHLHLREMEGSGVDRVMEDMVTRLQVAHDDDEIPGVFKTPFRERIIREYEGVRRGAPPGCDAEGDWHIPFVGQGKIGGALPLDQLNEPTVEVEVVQPPGGGTGTLRGVKYGLVEIENATTGEPVRRA